MCAVPRGTAVSDVRPRLELADIVRAYGDDYRWRHRLAAIQHRALRAIETCRTAALGGHRETCDRCGAVRVTYNCRNRHCPKCQTLTKARWLAGRRADLLPIPYFHVVFTLPHNLNPLAQGNPRVIYALLFRAAADTLLTFGRDPRHLGGTIGITAILHTWGQTLSQHLHVHCLVTGGALTADRSRWIAGRSSFLFPVRALSTVFRAKYLAGLRRAFDAGELTFARGTADLAEPGAFTGFLGQLRASDWVVYAKRPFAGPEQVLNYLGRYTHRVALSNDRLVDHRDGHVRFRWKDYADHDRVKILTLEADEFLRRFLLHVVPRGFMRIRHFGLLANRTRRDTLTRCRRLLGHRPAEDAAPESVAVLMQRLTGIDLARCPVCGEGRMRRLLDATAGYLHDGPGLHAHGQLRGHSSGRPCSDWLRAWNRVPTNAPARRLDTRPPHAPPWTPWVPPRARPSVESRTASRPSSLTISIALRRRATRLRPTGFIRTEPVLVLVRASVAVRMKPYSLGRQA